MQETVKERLIQYLQFKKIGRNKFESLAGISSGYISNLKSTPGTTHLTKIITAAPDLDEKWLLTGEGNMLKENSNAKPFTPHARAGIPLVSQYAYAGYLGGYGDPEYVGTLPTIDFTPDREMTGNWLAFEVKGDSMDNGSKESYVEGEIVICREVEPEYWRDSRLFINKRDFVIVHEEGILIKRITEHNVEAHTITIHSLNPMYPDRTLNLEHVHQIFSIVESRVQRRR
jgi:phage repressor protein C with HTH and peptisase S24 domain